MSRIKVKTIVLIFTLFWYTPSFAQDLPQKKQKTSLSIEDRGGKTYFIFEGTYNYHKDTVLSLGLKYVESEEIFQWYRVQLKEKKFRFELGPFKKTLLPGRYEVEVWFKMVNQPTYLAAILQSKYSYSRFYSKKIDVAKAFWGSSKEKKKVFKEIGKQFLTYLKKAESFEKQVEEKVKWSKKGEIQEFPPLTEWRSFRKGLYKDIKQLIREIGIWKKSYLSLVRYQDLEFVIMAAKKVYRLCLTIEKILQYQRKAKGKEKKIYEHMIGKKKKEAKNLRKAIGDEIYRLRKRFELFINPKKIEGGEEGVE